MPFARRNTVLDGLVVAATRWADDLFKLLLAVISHRRDCLARPFKQALRSLAAKV